MLLRDGVLQRNPMAAVLNGVAPCCRRVCCCDRDTIAAKVRAPVRVAAGCASIERDRLQTHGARDTRCILIAWLERGC